MKFYKIFLSLIILTLIIVPINAKDSELISNCGGDNELIISCLGDDELNNLGNIEKQPVSGTERRPIPEGIENRILFGIGFIFLILLFLIILLILKKYSRKKRFKNE